MKEKTSNKPPVNACTEYEMDLTDYVRGDMTFLTKEKQDKLFVHLRKCVKCRKEFSDWENVHAMLVSKAHHDKPETKQKLAELKERLKREFLPHEVTEKITVEKVGWMAGDIVKFLEQHGTVSLTDLPEKIKRDPYLTVLSTGWLARENKVWIDPKEPPNVSLNR